MTKIINFAKIMNFSKSNKVAFALGFILRNSIGSLFARLKYSPPKLDSF